MAEQTLEINRQALIQGGLSDHQATLYQILVEKGPMQASKTARLAAISRPLGYKVLSELIGLGLVEKKEEEGKIALFVPTHPLKLKEIAEKNIEAAKDAKNAIEGTLAKLISDFNTVAGQPGIRILEGVSGIAELYEDELNEAQDIRLIRSPLDDRFPELAALVQKQIKSQADAGIHIRAITPLREDTPASIIAKDPERLVTRRIVPFEKFQIPAQIVIYANKVAITSYEGVLITTLIENPAIRMTFEILFEYMWELAAADHERIMRSIASHK